MRKVNYEDGGIGWLYPNSMGTLKNTIRTKKAKPLNLKAKTESQRPPPWLHKELSSFGERAEKAEDQRT